MSHTGVDAMLADAERILKNEEIVGMKRSIEQMKDKKEMSKTNLLNAITRFRSNHQFLTTEEENDLKHKLNISPKITIEEFQAILKQNMIERKVSVNNSHVMQWPVGVAHELPASTTIFNLFKDGDAKGFEDIVDTLSRIISEYGSCEEKYQYLVFLKTHPYVIIILLHISMNPSNRRVQINYTLQRCCFFPADKWLKELI
jgi:hypothetical protein